MKYYTGIGSRGVPDKIVGIIEVIASQLAKKDYILRSGGADGCDLAFENGCDYVGGKKEIFIPWVGFNDKNKPAQLLSSKALPFDKFEEYYTITALQIAASIHPAWDKCSKGAKKCHSRNCFQVLGTDLKSPTSMVICWTPNGEDVGGTRTAIVLARREGIPVFNLANQNDLINVLKKL